MLAGGITGGGTSRETYFGISAGSSEPPGSAVADVAASADAPPRRTGRTAAVPETVANWRKVRLPS